MMMSGIIIREIVTPEINAYQPVVMRTGYGSIITFPIKLPRYVVFASFNTANQIGVISSADHPDRAAICNVLKKIVMGRCGATSVITRPHA